MRPVLESAPEKILDSLIVDQKDKAHWISPASRENRSQVPHHLHMCDVWQTYDLFQKHSKVFINEEMVVDLPKILKFSELASKS